MVCTLPVASALKSLGEDVHITWVVDSRFKGITECCTSIDTIVDCRPSFKLDSFPRFEEEFDLALDMQGLTKSGMVVKLAKAKQKLGYHWQRELAPLFSQRVLPDPSSFHVVDQYLDVARAAGADVHRATFNLFAKNEDREKMTALLAANGVTGPFVVMNAGAGWVTKRWPATHFATVVEQLAAQGIASVLIGGKAEADQEAAASVMTLCNNQAVNLLGQTSVRELVALISLGNAHLGGDTGSTHVAAALGVPAVGLYSITRPQRSCPYGQIERCHYSPDGLASIEPEGVYRSCMEAMA
ncbi:MAG TPA: glycosyltransferase family 9 protein [Fimbriimonas sp.]|nr:glycosyltransferase family 9 protein [Fimbriimonas sp.]